MPLFNLTFGMARIKGFLTHSGHSYHASDRVAVKKIYNESLFCMQQVQQHFPGLEISIGDTPGCNVMDDFTGVDEIRPGNFVFYDLMQYQLGSCALKQIAVQLATPVLSVYPEKLTIRIHGGAVHFSKERVSHTVFGEIFGASSKLIKWDGTQIDVQLPLTGISQEH
jgi:D-serine deaminase-like pyridoxal phosphate-dependent protein